MADSGLDVPPDRRVSRLSVGEKQRLEILKVLYRGARILVLDEPTAVLTPQEVEGLFVRAAPARRERALDHLHLAQAERGAGDRRPHRGAARRPQGRGPPGRGRRPRDARRADGRARGGAEPPHAARAGRRRCWCWTNVTRRPIRTAAPGWSAASLTRACGRDRRHRGRVGQRAGRARRRHRRHDGARGRATSRSTASRSHATPRASIAAGIGRIPEDRHHEGIVGALSIAENLALETLRDAVARAASCSSTRCASAPKRRSATTTCAAPARTRRSGCSPAATSRR